jgi:hypothetical protein
MTTTFSEKQVGSNRDPAAAVFMGSGLVAAQRPGMTQSVGRSADGYARSVCAKSLPL